MPRKHREALNSILGRGPSKEHATRKFLVDLHSQLEVNLSL